MNSIKLELVRLDGGTQSRVAINKLTVAEYADAMTKGANLPPVTLFYDGVDYWLADGFHRYHAHCKIGALTIAADVHDGTCRDAMLHAAGANIGHGLRRSNEDKQRAVKMLLDDPEWSTWSGSEIARKCGVSYTFVDAQKASLAIVASEPPAAVNYTTKHGTTATMQTANIGKAKPAAPETEPAAPDPAPVVEAAPSVTVPASSVILDADEYQEMLVVYCEMHAELEVLNKIIAADEQLKAAVDDVHRYKALADNAERTLAAKNAEFVERAQAVIQWKKRAERAEKELRKLKHDMPEGLSDKVTFQEPYVPYRQST